MRPEKIQNPESKRRSARSTTQNRSTALEVTGLSKRFGVVQALEGVDLDVRAGEVHALVGENGAGKSTLINILAGAIQPDAGQIRLGGAAVRLRTAHEAQVAGIAAVFQELSLVDSLSVAENIFANRQPAHGFRVSGFGFRLPMINGRELRRRTREILEVFEVAIDPDEPVERLSVAERQVVEILKALSTNPCVLLFDEPTSSLTRRETEILFDLIRRLRSEGEAMIYVSHHLPEVLEVADRVTVLRDGRHVATRPCREVSEPDLVRLMVGRELRDIYGRRGRFERAGPPRLRVEGLSRPGGFEDVGLELWPGEIVGMAGLVGAGRTEVGRALFGAEPAVRGTIQIDGRPVWPRSPRDAMRAGIAYLTEDRKTLGLYLGHSIRENLAVPGLGRFSSHLGWVRDKQIDAYAERSRARFRIVAPDVRQTVQRLSGGNQQKVLLATWIGIEPRVLIADEPTRGVDVGARTEIYGHLRELAANGAAVLLISSDLQEILGMSDRILVMRGGRIVTRFERDEATEEAIITAALATPAVGGSQ